MSYSDFITSLGNGCSMIFNALFTMANSLINNYIVITLIGLSLFSFVFYSLVGLINSVHKDKNDLDNYGGGKK